VAAAVTEDRILVTLDRDFANVLLYPPETTAGVAVVRLGRRASRQLLASVLASFLTACENDMIRGKLWIVEPGRTGDALMRQIFEEGRKVRQADCRSCKLKAPAT
jgi:hypothetical protein